MQPSKMLIFALAGLLMFSFMLAGCAGQAPVVGEKNAVDGINATENRGQLVGGDRDAHGCIGSAGYTWCEPLNKCLRVWEENCTAKTAAPSQASPLRVLTEDFPPYNFRDSNGVVSGRSTEMVREIMRRTGTNATIELMSWSAAYNLALAGPGTLLYSAGRTPEREKQFKWVGPLGAIGEWEYTFYERTGANHIMTNLSDAMNVRAICVVKDDAREQFLLRNGFANLQTADTDMQCASQLAADEVDLWLGSSTSFDGIIGEAGLNASMFEKAYAASMGGLHLAFSYDTPNETVDAWQKALDDIKADGTYDAIVAKYPSQ